MKIFPDTLSSTMEEFIALRRDIHSHPELGLQEQRTSALVASLLASWGYSVTTGLAETGVVGQLRRGKGARRLGLRADMDALPIVEQTGLAYASRIKGVMHACGHDGHTATLLAAARYLAEHDCFNGTLNLIFQPAEEHPGGARLMIQEGLFERFPCDAIYAMHNMPGIEQGRLVFIDGPAMASSDDVTITLHGTGGHGAMPHRASDSIVAAASIVLALQTVVSRNVDPLKTAVITVGAICGGKANNVIPDKVVLELSVRALDRDVRKLLEQRIHEIVVGQVESYKVRADISYRRDYPVLVNTPKETDFAREVAINLLGVDRVTLHGTPLTSSEDFAYMLEHCPGSYLLIGNGAGEGSCMVHNPGYDFNDENILTGSGFWCELVKKYLQ
ncbi:M20 aminoacylase family protein [Glaciimonas sp. GG7]